MAARFFADYGMLAVLAVLCAFLCVWTIAEQHPSGAPAANQLAVTVIAQTPANAHIAILARDGQDDKAFAAALRREYYGSCRSLAAERLVERSIFETGDRQTA